MRITALLALVAVTLISHLASAQECPRNKPLRFRISRDQQIIVVYERGKAPYSYYVSTGSPGHDTPNYAGPFQYIDRFHDSNLYPEGDYQDPETGESLGNMPYAMGIIGPVALHGTPLGNYGNIGFQASHGCVRMYSPQAKKVNLLLRKYGLDRACIDIGDFPNDGSGAYPKPKGKRR